MAECVNCFSPQTSLGQLNHHSQKQEEEATTNAVSFPLCLHGNYIIYLVNILSSFYFINQSLSWLIKSYSTPSL